MWPHLPPPIFSFMNILFQHKASFPKRFLEETGNPRVCLCPVGTATHVTLVSVPGSVLGSYIRWEEERAGAVPLTQPKPPWDPMPAGQWAPAPTQPAPLPGHASCPLPPRRHTQRTTHQSCTGNLERRQEALMNSEGGQRAGNLLQKGLLQKCIPALTFNCL